MRYHHKIILIKFILLSMLAGCNATGMKTNSDMSPSNISRASDLAGCDSNNAASEHLDVALIRKLMEEERYHAALAQIDALRNETSYTRYIRARIMHQLKQPEAEARYMELLGSCMDGYARHGLGLLAAEAGDMDKAVEYLRSARDQFPLDPVLRNDYGYALLLNGNPDAAYFEFITALEMESAALQPRYNALLVLLFLDRNEQARQFVERMNIPARYVERAHREAENLRARQGGLTYYRQDMSVHRVETSWKHEGDSMGDALMLQLETGITPTEHSP